MTNFEAHTVTVEPNDDLACSCGFRAQKHLFGGREAKRVAYAHGANPYVPLSDLLDFVGRRP